MWRMTWQAASVRPLPQDNGLAAKYGVGMMGIRWAGLQAGASTRPNGGKGESLGPPYARGNVSLSHSSTSQLDLSRLCRGNPPTIQRIPLKVLTLR